MKIARITALSVLALAPLFAQPKQQPQDEEYARLVKEWTTSPQFMSPLVDHLPKAPGVPTPKDVLGYYIGAPKKLTHTADIGKYYRALAAASRRVKLLPAGTTDEGRECLAVAISDEDTIQNLDTYKGYLARLADPRGLSEAEAHRIISQAKPIYMFTGGLHSAETGPPEMLMELAYRLAADESPLYEQIRKNVIVVVINAADPDGRDRYTDWYYRHMLDQQNEQDRVPGPPYWGKYIFHDNNRDINYSQVTMRNWLAFYLEWHPPIMHDLHESEPLMYTFSGQPPQNPTLDPILYAELPWFAEFELTKMIGYGMPGVWTHAFVDMWSPGYLGFMASNHNGMLRMYETFGNGGANTMRRTIGGAGGRGGEPPAPPAGGAEAAGGRGGRGAAGAGGMTAREWYRPLPPPRELVWSMRNNTNYMETGVLSALELTSAFPRTVLENFYLKSRNSIKSGETEAPYGYVLPAGQPDMTRVAFIVNVLRLQGIEVGRATAEVKLKDGSFPAGSLIVKRNQPYGRLAKILLEKQVFPNDATTTYDDTGWTMGLMSNAEVKEIADKAILDVKTQPVDRLDITGTVKGEGPVLAVLDNGSNNLFTFRYRLKDVKFEAIEKSAKAGDTDLPAGSFLLENTARTRAEVEKLGLQSVALDQAPNVARHAVDLPRLAMFSTWGSTQDVGWVRYAFDHFEIPYDLIYKERIRKGNLRADYDVILIPSQGRGGGKALVFDVESRGKPISYVKSPEFPSLGMYGSSEDITGGMGIEGVAELDKFVNQGGVLITLGASSFMPAEFGIARTVDAAHTTPAFYAPGPIVEAQILRPEHPIFYGYTQTTIPVRWANGPLLRVGQDDRRTVLMQFPGQDKSVLSGLMRGVAETRNRPAVVDMPVGAGRVVLFATNPCYRWQNLGEFGMLANSILHFNDYPKPAPPRPPAPSAPGQ
ncbi:MAG TPA: M14 family zinc carboxypeptidase [Bryobacteraceae bacterium]|nr:M14 family zinc carboxypeptidase [Bryobacteraceae bacterium]